MEAAVAGEDDHTYLNYSRRCHGPHDTTPQRLGFDLPSKKSSD